MWLLALLLVLTASDAPPDPQDLVGTWQVDLRPTPEAEPYVQPFVVTSVVGNVMTGTFYGSPIERSQVNTDWGGVRFAFVTLDGRSRYVTVGQLVDGRMEGTTYSPDRELLQPWRAERTAEAP